LRGFDSRRLHRRLKSGPGCARAMTTSIGSAWIGSGAADAGEAGIGGGMLHCKT
jgi:hypothetical protein